MAKSGGQIPIYLEVGKKWTFAGALDWPGWCRRARDEEAAVQALFDYGQRYERALKVSGLEFNPLESPAGYNIVERIEGNNTTDFGAPDAAPSLDSEPLNDAETQRLSSILKVIWKSFDAVVVGANGKELSKGPRGGGLELDGVAEHVLGANRAYVAKVGHKAPNDKGIDVQARLTLVREEILEALDAGRRGDIPEFGPRGGVMWTARYFVRRVAWHELDHLWEIEDRIVK